MGRRQAAIGILLLLTVGLGGCLDPYRVHVPEPLLDGSPHEWVEATPQRSDGGFFGPDEIETVYRFTGETGGPYQAVLHAIGLRAIARIDDNEILDQSRDILHQRLENEGVRIDPSQEQRGSRTLANGAQTQWILVVGSGTSNSFFGNEEEVRALAETWYDGRSSTNVVAVAVAQTTGPGGLFGSSTIRDESVWQELVGDRRGSIRGATHQAGFIDNLVTHG